MKKVLVLLLVFWFGGIAGQEKADRFSGEDSGQKRDRRMDQMNFVPNEVLVRFKDEVIVVSGAQLKSAGISSVDKTLKDYGINSIERLFPEAKKLRGAKIVKDPHGRDMKIPNLDNIFRIKIPTLKSTNSRPVDVFQFIEEMKALPEVEYAEPNYILSVDNSLPSGPVIYGKEMENQQKTRGLKSGFVPNDPLYNQQWYIPAVKADEVWNQTTGDTTQVIAILDTGVDWSHPDLKNKIWMNRAEIPGNNRDDDGNGLIDDVRGWDYINNDNNPTDDNSHGTHVAGIAAAEANNGIGISGVCPSAKIMVLKVFQSSGRGDVATITKGIIYASQKGATVINMSFGTYARSQAMEDALANAYATSALVAAAGNDALNLESCIPSGPFYPAALSYVLGVQSPEASFSNIDCNGPTFSNTNDLLNYEMKAPGTEIISTIPNGNYRVYQGTSMAAPIVSGAVCMYRKLIPPAKETNEFMWVKLIQATDTYLDIYKALTLVPKPEVRFLNNVMVDTLGIDDKDGRVDAGETIQLWFKARNTGGQVDSVYWKIKLAEFEDTSTCKIIKPTSYIGSISPYSTRTSEKDPMVFKISEKVAHDRDITFDLKSWFKGSKDTTVQKFVFTAENGEQLSGVIDTVKILYPNKQYIVNNSFKIGTNGTLIIKPGTKIMVYEGKPIVVKGGIIAIGKPDSLIRFTGYNPPPNSGDANSAFNIQSPDYIMGQPQKNPKRQFEYCFFEKLRQPFYSGGFSGYPKPNVSNSIFSYVFSIREMGKFINNNCTSSANYGGDSFVTGDTLISNNFIAKPTSSSLYISDGPGSGLQTIGYTNFIKNNNFINMSMGSNTSSFVSDPRQKNAWISEYSKLRRTWNNTYYEDKEQLLTKFTTYGSNDLQKVQNQYWGTKDSTKIEGFIQDFMEYPSYPRAVFKPFLTAPPDSCHGVVWKVLVNGKDAQDEKLDPVGIGKQRFDVYFNRPMNKTVNPQVAFGVRYPFSSNAVDEEGKWSDDGKIFTIYKTVKLTSGDGINRVRISGAKDLEGWEIPLEDMRFNFLISAAGSASAEFMATAGLGKVKLEWNNNDLEDGLGYNMYRMENLTDTTLTKPVLINKTLIADTLYTDFTVAPNKKYYYYYKILRTNMAETDSSKVVSAIPLTASKGDTNGDLAVNVMDITTLVAYLLNNNPQPFISEAADVNSDKSINVLDVVGIVNLVLNGNTKSAWIQTDKQAYLYVQHDTLFADSPVPVGGIQLDLNGVSSPEEVQRLKALEGFESGYTSSEKGLFLLYYSISGKTIASGNRIPLLKLKKGSGITSEIFADEKGSPIKVEFKVSEPIPPAIENRKNLIAELGQNYPNPLNLNEQTIIPVQIYQPVDEAVIRIVNMAGQVIEIIRIVNPTMGENLVTRNVRSEKGYLLYTLEVRQGSKRIMSTPKKMVVR